MNVHVLEGREGWYRFPKIISSSVATGVGKFYFLLPWPLSPTKSNSVLWKQKCSQSSLPNRMEGSSSQEEPTQSPGTCSGAVCTCQRFPTAASQMGLEISGWGRRKEVALPLSHASVDELLGRGWLGSYGEMTDLGIGIKCYPWYIL